MSVFRAANGHLISTIESKSTNPSGDAPKNVFSMSTNKPHEPVISSNFCFAFSSLSIPHCSDSGNFLNFDFSRRHKISFNVFAVSVVIYIFIILPKLLAVNLLFLSLSHSSLLHCPIVKIGIDSEYNLQWFLSQPITGNIWIHTTIMGPIKILEDYEYFSCKYSSNFLVHRTKCKTSRTIGKCFFFTYNMKDPGIISETTLPNVYQKYCR
jgi:hypothetical protein